MTVEQKLKINKIVRNIYLALPFTLFKQFFFFRFHKPRCKLPDFMCIGTQKSGTTWLFEQLKANAGISMAYEKEVHYFDWFFYRPLSWYSARFPIAAANEISGEITPGYSIIEKGRIKFIKRIMPGVKLILLFRDPRERAWSSARYHFGKQMKRDLGSISAEEFISHFKTTWVEQRGDYEMIWKKWSAVFPREQLHVVFTEMIEAEPMEALQTITDFLGVKNDANKTALKSRPNKSEEMEMPPEVKAFLDNHYLPMIKRMPEWLGIENKYWKI